MRNQVRFGLWSAAIGALLGSLLVSLLLGSSGLAAPATQPSLVAAAAATPPPGDCSGSQLKVVPGVVKHTGINLKKGNSYSTTATGRMWNKSDATQSGWGPDGHPDPLGFGNANGLKGWISGQSGSTDLGSSGSGTASMDGELLLGEARTYQTNPDDAKNMSGWFCVTLTTPTTSTTTTSTTTDGSLPPPVCPVLPGGDASGTTTGGSTGQLSPAPQLSPLDESGNLTMGAMRLLAQASTGSSTATGQAATPCPNAAAIAAFNALLPVLQSPRCANCHGAMDISAPNTTHPGGPQVYNGDPDQLKACATCHSDRSVQRGDGVWRTTLSAAISWGGGTPNQMCVGLLTARATPRELIQHLSTDALVTAGFTGTGGGAVSTASPPPMTQQQFVQAVQAWLNAGNMTSFPPDASTLAPTVCPAAPTSPGSASGSPASPAPPSPVNPSAPDNGSSSGNEGAATQDTVSDGASPAPVLTP